MLLAGGQDKLPTSTQIAAQAAESPAEWSSPSARHGSLRTWEAVLVPYKSSCLAAIMGHQDLSPASSYNSPGPGSLQKTCFCPRGAPGDFIPTPWQMSREVQGLTG